MLYVVLLRIYFDNIMFIMLKLKISKKMAKEVCQNFLVTRYQVKAVIYIVD